MSDYDDGSSVEEYMDALNSPEVQEILNKEEKAEKELTETQSFEQVVMPPVRNKKKGELPDNKAPLTSSSKPIPVQPDISKPSIASTQDSATMKRQSPPPEAPQKPNLQKQPMVNPQPEPVTEAPAPMPEPELEQQAITNPPPPPVIINTFDDYIKYNAERVRQQYYEAGDIASQQYLQSTYEKLFAIADGRAQVVTAQPEQPPVQQVQEPEPEPVVEQKPIDNVDEKLKRIDQALADPLLAGNRLALLKAKCELLGVPFDASHYQEPQPAASPNVNKVVKDGKVKREPKRWSLKAAIAMIALVGILGAAIVLLINILTTGG